MKINWRETGADFAVGSAILGGLVALFYAVKTMINWQWFTWAMVGDVMLTGSVLLMTWSMGGMFRSWRRWRQMEKAREDERTERAFSKLSSGKTAR
jgi:hypothetical protein